MTSGEVGTWLALILGLGGAIGVLMGGFLAQHLAIKDARWYVWIPAIAAIVAAPFAYATYSAGSVSSSLLLFIVPGFLATVYLGNTLAMVHGLVGSRMRALASAILFFVLNLIGLGLGPWSVGVLSDYLEPSLGVESLRTALIYVVPLASVWSAIHFVLAAKHLRTDLAAAPN
jgi:MFS family permease